MIFISNFQALYHGLSQYFQSKVCNTNKAVGEEISRLLDRFEDQSVKRKSFDGLEIFFL
jgi:hypothetical protein